MKKWIWFVLLVGILLGVGAVVAKSVTETESQGPRFDTVPIQTGSLASTISATGTIEPMDLIDVGAQVAGRILSFGVDEKGHPIDYGSKVEEGQILARIDDSTYKASVAASEASVAQAKANLASANAQMVSYQAKYDQAKRDWDRARKLGPSEALAQSSYDSYQSALEVAAADLKVGQAAIQQAEAGLQQAQANLDRAKQDLGYCVIQSPVKGVIIDRRVNIGQTVVASLSAPSLFLLAKDLTQVQVWVAVNEADIGHVHPGQPATFTVDAFPDETFTGTVSKIRLNASMTQNVVTYTVEVNTGNANGRLLPYLTANVEFETARKDHALLVPNAALHWSPPASLDRSVYASPVAAAPSGESGARAKRTGEHASNGASGEPAANAAEGKTKAATLWVLDKGRIHPVEARIGMTSGSDTEVSGPEIHEGMTIVKGLETGETGGRSTASSNPFIPQFHRGGQNNGQKKG